MTPVPHIASILVVCDGNHCRSPIGAALLRAALGGGHRVESAGLTALEGLPPDPEAQRLAAEQGLDIGRHRGRQLTPAMALAADLILVMDERQKADCERIVPSVRGRVFLLGHWQAAADREIPDPFRQGPEAMRRTFERISRAVPDWRRRLSQGERFV